MYTIIKRQGKISGWHISFTPDTDLTYAKNLKVDFGTQLTTSSKDSNRVYNQNNSSLSE